KSAKTSESIKKGIITVECVEGAVNFIEWQTKNDQTKSINQIDDIVKLTEKGEELIKQIEAGAKDVFATEYFILHKCISNPAATIPRDHSKHCA
ncbi:hypothetical protein C1645_826741, partial [Glomus cerebriforme]